MSSAVEVILNASAGAGAGGEAARAVEEAFAACGVEARVHLAREGAEIEGLARRAPSRPRRPRPPQRSG